MKDFTIKPATGPTYSASRPSKDKTDFAVAGYPEGPRALQPHRRGSDRRLAQRTDTR